MILLNGFRFPELWSTYTFVTHEDVCRAFEGETLLAIVTPAETQLEVPVPETVVCFQKFLFAWRSS